MSESLRAHSHSAAAVCAAVILIACSSVAVIVAQNEKVTTPEDLDKVMKKAQPAMQATSKALASGAYADAKTQLATLRQVVLDSQNFWLENKREDAVRMNKETLAKIDTLDRMLGVETVNPAAATSALKEVGGSCRMCHQKYRTTDAENNYILKPGSLEGQ